MCPAATLLVAVALSLGVAGAQSPPAHHHDFLGAERWAQHFDDPARDRWQKPHEVIRALDVPRDGLVADIGAGTGYFTMRIARMTPGGRVFAVDIEPDMVQYLTDRARRESLGNVIPTLGKPDDPRLPANVDRVLVVDTYHHIDARERYFARLKASLKAGATVAIIDFTPEAPLGPPPPARVPRDEVVAEMGRAGYALAATHGFLPYQYFLVFRPR